MLTETVKIIAAAAALLVVKLLTGYDLLGERGPGDYLMLLAAPLAAGIALTVICKGRLRWSYGILAVTAYCFGSMLYMGKTGYASGASGANDPTVFIIGVTSLNWAVLALFAGLGGGLGWAYYKIREVNEGFGD